LQLWRQLSLTALLLHVLLHLPLLHVLLHPLLLHLQVIFLYLLDNETSMVVLFSAGESHALWHRICMKCSCSWRWGTRASHHLCLNMTARSGSEAGLPQHLPRV
jgi:hypothetical protein